MAEQPSERTPTTVYRDAVETMERALAEAARAQWAGQRPDLHVFRRALIDARRAVPNDRLDPVAQVVRDLLTAYAAVLDDLAQSDTYRRADALTPVVRADLERLRPRAARHRLPVLDDRFGFTVGARRPASDGATAPRRPRPADTAGAPAAAGTGRPRRRRRPRGSGPGER